MDTIKNLISKPNVEPQPDLNKPEDVRRVIEKVEVIDSVDVDAIHSTFAEIAEEKAAARVLDKSEGSESKLDKPKKAAFPGFSNFPDIDPLDSEKLLNTEKNKEANVSASNKSSLDEKGIDLDKPNPYIDNDNFTAFFD